MFPLPIEYRTPESLPLPVYRTRGSRGSATREITEAAMKTGFYARDNTDLGPGGDARFFNFLWD
jgi:hypothetical protein